MKILEFLIKEFRTYISVPIVGLAISTYFTDILLTTPLSLKGCILSFSFGLVGLVFILIVTSIIIHIEILWRPKLFSDQDEFSITGFISLGLLTWAIALTLAYYPTEKPLAVAELFHNKNFIRLLALYIIAISFLNLRQDMNKKTEK